MLINNLQKKFVKKLVAKKCCKKQFVESILQKLFYKKSFAEEMCEIVKFALILHCFILFNNIFCKVRKIVGRRIKSLYEFAYAVYTKV